MKRIRKEELEKLRDLIAKLPISSSDECVLFFPIEIEKETLSSEDGVSMSMSLASLNSGTSTLVNYGVIPVIDECKRADIVAVISNLKDAIAVNLNDYFYLVDNSELTPLKEYECKLIKKSGIAFRINI